MRGNPKNCPYFVGMGYQVITCRGHITECELRQAFWMRGDEKVHYNECCSKDYNRCQVAQMLNSIWCDFAVQSCPNNSEVECLHTDGCDRCGWNPQVAEERLRRYMDERRMQC